MPIAPNHLPETRRNRELDWLRAYAILLVVADHAAILEPYPTVWTGIVHVWYEGRTGVDLFFVISGYVISRSFLDAFDAARLRGKREAWREAADFYVRRLIRLCPAAIAWALAILVGSVLCAGSGAFPPPSVCLRKFVAAVLYVSNWSETIEPTRIGYFYSLATEMQFYLVLPLVLAVVPRRHHRLGLACVVFLLGSAGCPGLDSNPDLRFSGIVAGIALFLVSRSAMPQLEPRVLGRPLVSAAFTLAVVAALATCSIPSPTAWAVNSHIAALLACALVGAAIHQKGYVSPLGVPRLLDWIGSRSYSLYLCHIPIMLLNRSWLFAYASVDGALTAAPLVPDPILVIAWLATTVLATEATYRLLEQPFQANARRWASRLLTVGATVRRRPEPVPATPAE